MAMPQPANLEVDEEKGKKGGEKEEISVSASPLPPSPRAHGAAERIDPAIERRVIRKCDLRVIPPTFLLFIFSFLDRVNIGNARIQGMTEDLHMIGSDYNVALLVFFVPFILCEVPSNIIMRKLKPSTWLSGLLFFCGIITVSMGFVQSQGALIAVRFLLGIFESGTAAGCVYMISMYYRRYELQRRLSWWYSSSMLAGAFGGLLAYAIAHLDGVHGYGGWRWIFILEGSVCAAVGILMRWILVDWPENATFLTEEERAVLQARLSQDHREEARMDQWNSKRILKDWKVYIGIFIFFGLVNTNYASAFFIPTILVELGYRAVTAQLYTIPIYAAAAVCLLTVSYLSDRLRHRYAFILLGTLLACAGEAVLLAAQSSAAGVKYFALFLVVSGANVAQPLVFGWLMNNVAGHYKRAFAAAAQTGWGNAAGFVASTVFFAAEAPAYTTGYAVSLALLACTALLSTVMLLGLRAENARRRAGGRDDRLQAPDAGNLGDDDPRFRFTY